MNRPHEHDDDLERLLADDGGEFGRLYRRLPRNEPPRRLDRSVLGDAARALLGELPRRQRWLIGLGSFAGVALAAGLAWHVGQDALRVQGSAPEQRIVVPVEPITVRPPKPEIERAAPPEESATPPAAAAAPPAAQTSAPRAAAPKRSLPQTSQPPAAPAPLPQPFPAAPASPKAAPAEIERAPAAAPESRRVEPQSATPTRPATSAPALSSSVELRRDLQLPPARWIARIRQLLQEGRRQQAIDSLRLFQRAHPAQPVPADLRALLEQADE